jgi:hypothetical protein
MIDYVKNDLKYMQTRLKKLAVAITLQWINLHHPYRMFRTIKPRFF